MQSVVRAPFIRNSHDLGQVRFNCRPNSLENSVDIVFCGFLCEVLDGVEGRGDHFVAA